MSTTSQVAPAARADGHAAAVTQAAPSAVAAAPAPRSRADRFMLRMLRIDPATVDKIDTEDVRKAHRAFRWAVVVSAVRCTIMYVIIPVLIPMLSVLGSMAAPINIGLCLVAMGNGWLGVRRFWKTDHRGKWGYTWFMALIYAISIWTIIHEIAKLVA
jgi:hypothetical protein